MGGEMREKQSGFELWVLALTAVILLLMVGWFAFGSVGASATWWVEVERADSPEAFESKTEGEGADGLLEGETIDLNTAGAADLERLPGIGSARAQAIVEYRQVQGAFASVDELLKVDGIGPGILEQVRPYVTVG